MLEGISENTLVEIGTNYNIVIDVYGPRDGFYAAHLRDSADNSVLITTDYDFQSSEQARETMLQVISYAEQYIIENSIQVQIPESKPKIISVKEAINIMIKDD